VIIDCHTHAWEQWPYEPQVPNPDSHGRVEKLLWEMDHNGVDKAVLVCANIERNPDNNAYGAESARRYPERIVAFADVDCSWSPAYHTPGAADRLAGAAEKYSLKGFTHYFKDDYDWLESDEGLAFFGTAAERGLIASLSFGAAWHAPIRQLAQRFPELVIMGHHMAGTRASERPPYPNFDEILKSAAVPNIYLKLSGFAYVSQVD
jgi:predicted TIM-barrel fold metal-dependent hydrolase